MTTTTTPAEDADNSADTQETENQEAPVEQATEQTPDEKRSEADAEAFAGDVKGGLQNNDELFEKVEEENEGDDDNTGAESEESEEQNKETDASSDNGKDTDSDSNKETGKEAEADEKTPAEPAIDVEDEETPEDPGEFKPNDYSFEVITTDGKKHKIKTPEDADALTDLLDENPDLINARSLMEFIRKTSRMEAGIEADKKAYEAKKEEFDTVKEQQEIRDKTLISINNGMLYLQQKGMLEAVPAEYDNATTNWEEHTDIPAIKQRLDILKYMENENKSRMDVGLEPSFDVIAAYNAMQLEEMKTQKKTEESSETKKRQAKGAKVGSTAPYSQTNVGKGEIVGEGGSINELYDWS